MSGTLTTGDTRPALTGTATSDGTGANLTGATLVLHIRRPDPDATILTVTPAPVNPTAGTWSYTWQVTDLTIAGTWSVELQVTFADGGVETFGPASFSVRPQIA